MRHSYGALALLLIAVAGCATPTKTIDQVAAEHAVLTDIRMEKYLRSYVPAHTMARKYWGKRRYSNPHKMLPPRGTFERAFKEMEAAGTLFEFDLLLQSHGFDGHEAWMKIGRRISVAFVALRTEKRDPSRIDADRDSRDVQMRALLAEREKAQDQPTVLRKRRLRQLDFAQKQVERDMLAESDKDALRPYMSEFEALNKKIIERE